MTSRSHPLSLSTIGLLTAAPLLWAGNAVAGRMAAGWIPPVTLNILRWAIAFVLLWPLGSWVLKRGSPLWREWRPYAVMGLLAIAGYNTLQYLALKTSTPLNVTLVAASTPVWMLLVGRVAFGAHLKPQSLLGAVFSMAGVSVVLSQGDPLRLAHLELVPGDAWMLLAAFVWACYSWMLTRNHGAAEIRDDWAAFLLAQIALGLCSGGVMAAGEWWWLEHTSPQATHIVWSTSLVILLLYVAIGPAVMAYRCWGAGVQRAGPTIASFFGNLTPLFTALLSAALLGEPPHLYHAVAFGLIVTGIVVSTRR